MLKYSRCHARCTQKRWRAQRPAARHHGTDQTGPTEMSMHEHDVKEFQEPEAFKFCFSLSFSFPFHYVRK